MNGVLDFWCKLPIFDESSQTCPKYPKKEVCLAILCSGVVQNIQILYWVRVIFVVTYLWVVVVKNACGLLDQGTLKCAVSQESESIKWIKFFAWWYKLRKANGNLVVIGWVWSKMGKNFRSYGTLKSGASHIWFD